MTLGLSRDVRRVRNVNHSRDFKTGATTFRQKTSRQRDVWSIWSWVNILSMGCFVRMTLGELAFSKDVK
jgi:hypothetical protein